VTTCHQLPKQATHHGPYEFKLVTLIEPIRRRQLMNKNRIAKQHHATFEGIRQLDATGQEFWLARQLAEVLDYSQYRHFLPVIERAKEACLNSSQPVENHMEDVLTMVPIGSGAEREVADIRLSRYACYLIVQNGDPSKPVIANGQTYFAMQTRREVDPEFGTGV
jgi:DNA-damage-inducible protein D